MSSGVAQATTLRAYAWMHLRGQVEPVRYRYAVHLGPAGGLDALAVSAGEWRDAVTEAQEARRELDEAGDALAGL
jgi:hypothetical protein